MEVWKRNLFVCWFGTFATAAGYSQLAPILPLFIDHLGIHEPGRIEQWSGFAFGITFIVSAIFSPIWGRTADKFGRKPMLIRASLGMAIIITCTGFVQDVYQLVTLRLILGTISGFVPAATTLVATQTPKERVGWALGTLSTGSVGGMLLGPLIGGYVAEAIGVRSTFFSIGIFMFLAFLVTVLFVQEEFTITDTETLGIRDIWRRLPNPGSFLTMLVTAFVMQFALMSIEPIVTVYVSLLSQNTVHVALVSGMVFAASGFANIMAAPRLGKLSDKIGPHKVMLVALIGAGILFIPQAFVAAAWQLGVFRFLLGIATAGLLPSINAVIKRNTPDLIAGQAYGFNQSALYLGGCGGSIAGGQIAAAFGIHYVFFATSALLLINAVWVYKTIYLKNKISV
jgi:MFS family permease